MRCCMTARGHAASELREIYLVADAQSTVFRRCPCMLLTRAHNQCTQVRFYHMIGNAVCPPVIQAIASQMLQAGLVDSCPDVASL